jgi:hypothetical protein
LGAALTLGKLGIEPGVIFSGVEVWASGLNERAMAADYVNSGGSG